MISKETLTFQKFNYIYFTFTRDKKGIRKDSTITTTGEELKLFLEHAIRILQKE